MFAIVTAMMATTAITNGDPEGAAVHPTCTTKDKASDPLHQCVFPFIVDGKVFNGCTDYNMEDEGGATWCATTGNYDRDSEWGVCEEGSSSPLSDEAACPQDTLQVVATTTTTTTTTVVKNKKMKKNKHKNSKSKNKSKNNGFRARRTRTAMKAQLQSLHLR